MCGFIVGLRRERGQCGSMRGMRRSDRLPLVLLGLLLIGLLWSGWQPRDRFIWLLEVAPAILGVGVLVAIYPRLRLTPLAYGLVFVHAWVLLVGGHWTYAEVPLGRWLQEALHLSRNPYDRIGHFAQGFVPAILTREILLRCTPLRPGGWLNVLVVAVCLAISATYELFEWLVAEATGEAAEAFLGMQGDVWDTQKDMAMCLIGAVTALATLSRWHDRQLAALLKG